MARDRVTPVVSMILTGCSGNEPGARTVIEALRLFGYINEQQYSEMNTTLSTIAGNRVRSDGAETLEFARHPMRSAEKVRNLTAEELGVAPLSKAIKKPQDDEGLSAQLREEILPGEH